MKRSQMIELMVESLSQHWNNKEVPLWDLKEQCDIILEKMERDGMLPPKVPKGTPWIKYKSDHDGSEQIAHLAYDVNKWEPEND